MIPKRNVKKLQTALDGDVHAAYGKIKEIKDVLELREASGVKTKISRKEIQAIYDDFFYKESYSIDTVVTIKRLSGIGPKIDKRTNEKLQLMYRISLNGYDFTDAENLKELTGIEPVKDGMMNEAVQRAYRFCFENDWVKNAIYMKEFTGISPSHELLKCYPRMAEALE